jgi:hypothetical protein
MLHFGQLVDDHDAIDALANKLISAARSTTVPAAQCRALLRAFTRQLRKHIEAETIFLAEDAASRGNAAFYAEVRAFNADFAELSAGWRGYLLHWSESAIARGRSGFMQQTIDMMTALKLRLEREHSIIYPLAIKAGMISPF